MTIPTQLVERLRDVHASMVDAVLSGERMREVAAIAARRVGRPVAVIIPSLGHELVEPEGDLTGLRAYVTTGGDPPAAVQREVVVRNGGERIGAIMLLGPEPAEDVAEADAVLHLAAMAAMTDLALVESRQQVEDELRGTFLEELRSGAELDAAEVIRRGERLGCDLSAGALILAGDPGPDRVHRFMAAVKAECPAAFVQRLDGRVYAVIPAGDEPDAEDRATASASVLAKRLQAHAPVGLSSFQRNAAELARSIEEADLVVDVLGSSGLSPDSLSDGTYRLLVRLLASDPQQLDAFYEESVAPLARYDEQYRTDLIGTLAAYLDHDGKLGAAAQALYAHRHTVAYRLERIRELTELDPARYEDRERLSLGLKIHRLTRRPSL
jgi:sugar diacid utilization regulator